MKKDKKTIDEEELLKTIDVISKKLSYKFKFGYHELEDMKQQISVFALEGLQNYDYQRPLENFLWTHVRNRLFNFKRDNYQRPNKPCITCPFFDSNCSNSQNGCTKFEHKLDCDLYKNWYIRNNAKKNLMYLSTIEELKECIPTQKNNFQNIENSELIEILEEKLFGEHREIYLKIKTDVKVTKNEILKLANKIQELLDE